MRSDMVYDAWGQSYAHCVHVPDDEVSTPLRWDMSPNGNWHPPACICGRPTWCPTPAAGGVSRDQERASLGQRCQCPTVTVGPFFLSASVEVAC